MLSLTMGLGLLAVTAPAAAAPLAAPVEAGRFTFDRSLVLPTPVIATPIREGGLSALQVEPGTGNRRFLSVSDRGPGGQPTSAVGGRTFLSPAFAPLVYELAADDDGRLAVLKRTPLRVPVADPLRATPLFAGDPSLVTGVRNVTTDGLDDRPYRMTSDAATAAEPATDPYGLDPEGIARDPRDGSFWVADEHRPSVVRFDANGVMRQRIVPAGTGALETGPGPGAPTLAAAYDGPGEPRLQELLPAEYKGRRTNRGLEGLTLSPDGTTLWAMMQNALDPQAFPELTYGAGSCLGSSDGPDASTSPDFSRNVRIVELDISDPGAPVLRGEWLYRTDSVSDTDAALQGKQRVSDIAWKAPGLLLVAEHDDNGDKTHRVVHEVGLTTATNLLDADGPNATDAARRAPQTVLGKAQAHRGCFFDNGSQAELTALGITPAEKAPYLDLGSAPGGVGFLFDKVEGIALLEGDAGVAVLNDNDFGVTQAANGTISGAANPAEELRFYASRPSTPAPVASGTPAGGHTLNCLPGGADAVQYSYAWLRQGAAIRDADGPRYTLTDDDVGTSVACRVVATRVTGAVRAPSLAATSTPRGPVAAFASGVPGAQGPPGTPGPAGPQGAPGTPGSNGGEGPQGAPGGTGAQGPAGAQGVQGAQGVTGTRGATGARGAPGPLPRVSCKLTFKGKGTRRTASGVACMVSTPATAARVSARVAGRTIASAAVRRGRATLRLPRSGRRATLVALDRKGRVVRSSRVTVG